MELMKSFLHCRFCGGGLAEEINSLVVASQLKKKINEENKSKQKLEFIFNLNLCIISIYFSDMLMYFSWL